MPVTTTMLANARDRHGRFSWKQVVAIICLLEKASAYTTLTGRPVMSRATGRPLFDSDQEFAVVEDQQISTQKLSLASLGSLDDCSSGTKAQRLMKNVLLDSERDSLYKSVSIPPGAAAKGISDGDLAIQTRLVNKKYSIMELIELSGDRDADRASLAVLCIMVGSSLSALVANQKMPGPEILRFLVVWIFSFAPLAFVGYGIKDAEKLQAVLISLQREIFPAYRQRMIQHEAGHFLMGHLLGWPIAGYNVNAVKNAVEFYPLSDGDKSGDFASQLGFDAPKTRALTAEERLENYPVPIEDKPFFSKEGRGKGILSTQSVFRNAKNYTENPFLKLPSRNEPTKAWPYRGFDDATVDQLAIISMAGVCAEILAFGNAEGGAADLRQLRQIFVSAETPIPEHEVENRIRYALGYTLSQLRRHLGALDALSAVMEKDGTVAECVLAIETCTNVNGQDGILGDYERRRREAFRSEGASWIERIVLGGEKNVDTEDNTMVEGKGGGYKKETFRLTGDDPFYAAIAVAVLFFAWASSGGLSLH